jgi:hypothetical protein
MVGIALSLWACDSTITKPVTLDQSSYSLSAEQRVFLSRDRAVVDSDNQRVTCAEPSPDALKAIAQSLSAQAQAAGYGGGGLSASSAESAASIGLRTATIQLLRDGLYRICEAYANGALSEFGYALALSNFDEIMIRLISVEGLTGTHQAAQVAIGTSGTTKGSGQSNLSITGEGAGAAEGAAGAAAPDTGGGSAGTDTTASVETETEAGGASTQPTIGTVTVAAPSSLSPEAVKAVQTIATSGRPGYHSVAAACLMWFSLVPDKAADANRQRLAGFCENYLNTLLHIMSSYPAQFLSTTAPAPVTQ